MIRPLEGELAQDDDRDRPLSRSAWRALTNRWDGRERCAAVAAFGLKIDAYVGCGVLLTELPDTLEPPWP